MKTKGFKLIIISLFLAALLFGLIRIMLVQGGQTFLLLELLGFLGLLLLALAGYISYGKSRSEYFFFFIFLSYMANLLLIWYVKGTLYAVLLILAVIGFLVSLPLSKSAVKTAIKKTVKSSPSLKVEPYSEVFDPITSPGEEEAKILSKAAALSKKTTTFTPGKYVGSKLGNQYHEPRCDWAAKIHNQRRVWFNGKDDAYQKGYRKHSCVQ